jgi:hypothetical protein
MRNGIEKWHPESGGWQAGYTVGGHKSTRWAVLHQNAPVALRDLEGFSGQDLP